MSKTDGPILEVSSDARRYIRDVEFHVDRYIDYLTRRGVSDDEVAKVAVQLGTKGGYFGEGGGYFSPRNKNDDDSNHIVAINVNKADTLALQGRYLRHETEHLIYHTKHAYHLHRRAALMGAGGIAVAGIIAPEVYANVVEMTNSWPEPLSVATAISAATAGSVMGGGFANIYAGMVHGALSRSEFSARRAEKKRQTDLPDGVLSIEYV